MTRFTNTVMTSKRELQLALQKLEKQLGTVVAVVDELAKPDKKKRNK